MDQVNRKSGRMRISPLLAMILVSGALLVPILGAGSAEARCRVWEATHNGSGLFYSNKGGAKGTAANKLRWQVEEWRKMAGVEELRIGEITTFCGKSFVKYFVPHKHYTARTRSKAIARASGFCVSRSSTEASASRPRASAPSVSAHGPTATCSRS